jgi:hypothetical protein
MTLPESHKSIIRHIREEKEKAKQLIGDITLDSIDDTKRQAITDYLALKEELVRKK